MSTQENVLYCKSNSIDYDVTKALQYNAKKTLMQYGFIAETKIASTLQGSVYIGKHVESNSKVIIKRTDINAHVNGIGKVNGKYVYVTESILNEAKLLIKLQKCNPVNGFTYIYNFIKDSKNYFLITKYGGISLFEYIKHYHTLLQNNEININIWLQHIKILFKQMIDHLKWLHSNGVCHMDISLENMTIFGSQFKDGKFINHGQVYFIDYGLAIDFNEYNLDINGNLTYMYDKNVGKSRYKAPELFFNSMYDCRLVDVWSLGICMFVGMSGVFPYDLPINTDNGFKCLINGNIKQLLIANHKSDYMDNDVLNVLNKMLCINSKRCYINDIQSIFCF